MESKKTLVVIAVLALFALSTEQEAFAQQGERGRVEVALLGGVTGLIPRTGDGLVAIGVPSGSSVFPTASTLRLTFWSKPQSNSQLIYDLGFSLLHLIQGEDNTGIVNVEGGVGGSLGLKESRVRPFGSVLLGILSASSNGAGESEAYVGAQIGVRRFFRDYAAARFQLAYRHMLGSTFDFDTVELSVGFGFLI